MPFDGRDFPGYGPGPDKKPALSENAVSWLISIGAALLLLMPVSVAALVDIIRYMRAPG